MSECVFALVQLNLINDRKEMGERKKERKKLDRDRGGGERQDGARREGGGREQVSEAENMVRNAVQQPFSRKYHVPCHATGSGAQDGGKA